MIPEWRKDQEPGQSECWSLWSGRRFNESEKVNHKNFQKMFKDWKIMHWLKTKLKIDFSLKILMVFEICREFSLHIFSNFKIVTKIGFTHWLFLGTEYLLQ